MPSEEHEQLQKTLTVIDGVLDHFPSGYLLGKTSQRDHDHNQGERAVDRFALENQAHRAGNGYGSQKEKERRNHLFFTTIARLVNNTFARETGSKSFQPMAINWS